MHLAIMYFLKQNVYLTPNTKTWELVLWAVMTEVGVYTGVGE
jgi:hypothetical protein